MNTLNNETYSEHNNLSQLLPWYVNQTLQGTELQAVESHLGVCLMCKREVIQLQKLAQAVVHEGALDSAERASFARLKSRLKNQATTAQRHVQRNHSVFDFVGHLSQRTNRFLPLTRPMMAMAAALLLSVILAPDYFGLTGPTESTFKTLSNGEQESARANEIRVVFAEHLDQQEKAKILERIHGDFIDRPTAQGVYKIRLGTTASTQQVLEIVELLRKDSNIIFVEPAYAMLSSLHFEKPK